MQLPSSNGILTLSIPVKGGRSVRLPYGEVEIDYKTDWQENHFRSISTVYGSSPFYQFYSHALQELYSDKIERLFDWNIKCLETFLKLSKMSNLIQYTISSESDARKMINLEDPSEGQNDLILPQYDQVFIAKTGFIPNMSCLDLLMNLGPDSGRYIQDLTNKLP